MKQILALCFLMAVGAAGALADDITNHMSNFSLGMGRNHDEAYNNAYAKNDNFFRLTCAITSGRIENETVDNETDSDFGRYGYQVNLSMEADCVTKGSDS